MIYFAYHPTTRPTGRQLADALGIVNRGTLVRKGRRIAAAPDFLIRWGNARYGDCDGPGRAINPAAAIWKAGDKLAALRAFQAAEVPSVRFHETCGGRGIVLARRRRGFGGRDIQICGHNPCVGGEFYTEFVPNTREYRIHVVGGKVVRVQRKYLERPELRRSEYIKNRANGYVFKAPRRRLNDDRHEAAIGAVAALGLDFGGVDLIVGEDNRPYVLEVNTAPACSPKTLNAYAQAIGQLINERSNGDYIVHPTVDLQAQLEDDE